MISKILSSATLGIDSYVVEVEVDVSNGLPRFNIVGLADTAIFESKERVRSALKNSGFRIPPKRVVVNLSPANIKKTGSNFDIPIAIGIMAAVRYIKNLDILDKYMFVGELSLEGKVKRSNGIINAVICAKEKNMTGIVVPFENYLEAKIIKGIEIIPVKTIEDIHSFIEYNKILEVTDNECESLNYESVKEISELDFLEVKGQEKAKFGLEIAASGGHNLYMVGSPGSGKTMLAKRFTSILPSLTQSEMIETMKIYSSGGLLNKYNPIFYKRPFRKPHHTATNISLIGGGRIPKAGEISLAHNGVLFLDEATEFNKNLLETLRQPLENKEVSIARIDYRITMPADFILIMAANPCFCGMKFEGTCSCTSSDIQRYERKISGPILDRIDLYIEIKKLKKEELLNHLSKDTKQGEGSEEIKKRVIESRKIQYSRFNSNKLNSEMNQEEIKKYCVLEDDAKILLENAVDRFNLTARSHDKLLKVARTISDTVKEDKISKKSLLKALTFRKE